MGNTAFLVTTRKHKPEEEGAKAMFGFPKTSSPLWTTQGIQYDPETLVVDGNPQKTQRKDTQEDLPKTLKSFSAYRVSGNNVSRYTE